MILVTGATGLVGTYLLAELLSNTNQPIRALYRSTTKLEKTTAVFLEYADLQNKKDAFDKIEWFACDIIDIPTLEKVFVGITEVYHVAGCVSFQSKDIELLRKINREGTTNMVNLSINFGVEKFCYVSSIATLNKAPKQPIYTEESHWDPELKNSIYAISKYGGEMEVWRAMEEGLNAVIVNPGVILGSGYWNNGSGRLFSGMKNGSPFYFEGGSGYVDVRDVVKIMRLLMQKNIFKQRYILVAENWTFKKSIEHIAKVLGKKPPSKKIPAWALRVISFLETIIASISNYKAKFSKELLLGLFEENKYDNSKIKKAINFEFIAIDKSIKEHGLNYIKEKK